MDTCVICLDDLKEDVKFLRCAHKFHGKCVDVWLSNNPLCPMCKTSATLEDPIPTPQSPNFSITSVALTYMESKLSQNPYIDFIKVLTREFTQNIIYSNYETMRAQIEAKAEPVNRLFDKAIALEKKLSDAGVDLTGIPLDSLRQSAPGEIVGFIYMKLLEVRDANNSLLIS